MALKLRQWFFDAMPSWQSAGDGTPLFWSLLRLADALILRSKLALDMHFPTRTGPSANAIHGATRNIQRGRTESDANYARRLTGYRYPRMNRVKGNPYAALDQIVEYFATLDRTTSVRCYIVTEMRTCWMRGASAVHLADTPTYSRDAELVAYDYADWFSWDGKPSTSNWSRFIVYVTPNPQLPEIQETPDLGDPTLWGGALGVGGYCIGLVGWTPADTVAMRKLFLSRRQWKPAWTQAMWLVVRLADWSTAPEVPDGSPDWGDWSFQDVDDVRRPARSAENRYICLSPSLQEYSGDPTKWTGSFVLPDGVTEYAGDPTSWPDSIHLPTGDTYAGNPFNWPDRINLVDDGDEAR